MAVPVLMLTGPSGAGKTVVAHELSAVLAERSVSHAVVDTDVLDHIHPPPPDDPTKWRLTRDNLAAVWRNLARGGAQRAILAMVAEDLDSEMRLVREAIPDADIAAVLLAASDETRSARLRGREAGTGLEYHLMRTRAVAAAIGAAPGDRLVVETDGLTVRQVADAVLAATGWA
jgi:AAA domain-containing protein